MFVDSGSSFLRWLHSSVEDANTLVGSELLGFFLFQKSVADVLVSLEFFLLLVNQVLEGFNQTLPLVERYVSDFSKSCLSNHPEVV